MFPHLFPVDLVFFVDLVRRAPKRQRVFSSVEPFVGRPADRDAVLELVFAVVFFELDVVHGEVRRFARVAAVRAVLVLAGEAVSLKHRCFKNIFSVDPILEARCQISQAFAVPFVEEFLLGLDCLISLVRQFDHLFMGQAGLEPAL